MGLFRPILVTFVLVSFNTSTTALSFHWCHFHNGCSCSCNGRLNVCISYGLLVSFMWLSSLLGEIWGFQAEKPPKSLLKPMIKKNVTKMVTVRRIMILVSTGGNLWFYTHELHISQQVSPNNSQLAENRLKLNILVQFFGFGVAKYIFSLVRKSFSSRFALYGVYTVQLESLGQK